MEVYAPSTMIFFFGDLFPLETPSNIEDHRSFFESSRLLSGAIMVSGGRATSRRWSAVIAIQFGVPFRSDYIFTLCVRPNEGTGALP